MKSIIKRSLPILFLTVCIHFSNAQVGINTDNSIPDASSMLDVKSTDKGILIPRMTTAQRTAISNPATGLLVFDNDTDSFWFFDGTSWTQLSADNLGNHIATQNIQLNGNYLSNDGDNEGVFIDTDGNIGIGTNTPSRTLSIVKEGINNNGMNITTYDNGFLSVLDFKRSAGTIASPTAVGGINTLGRIDFSGYDGSNFNTGARIEARVGGTWSGLSTPGFLRFYTTPANGSITERMYIAAEGNVGIGTIGFGGNAEPDASALLDLKSNDRGLLIPRMSTSQRTNISNPATSLLVYDNDVDAFWFYNGSNWASFGNTDNQDLSLSGNSLSLTNDGTPVDLSNYSQDLSLSGNSLAISGGNSVNLSSFNTNIYNTNGNITVNERRLTFSNTGATQHFTLKRSLNTDELGLAFQNSGSFYTSFITVPGDGSSNDGGLDFRTKNANGTLGNIENTMRLTDNGTVILPEYGQGNVIGTVAEILAVTSTGNIIETNISNINTDNQDLDLSGNTLSLTNDGTTVDLSGYLDNTDNQDLSLSGNSLNLTNDSTPVDLSSYLDNTDAQALSLNANDLTLTNGGSVDLSGYINTDNQDLSLSGNSLNLTNDGTSVDLSSYLDNTDTQVLSLSGNDLTLTNGGSVSLNGYLDNTDNQDLTLSGNNLTLTNGGSVDLSTIQIFEYDNTNKIVKPNTSLGDVANDDFIFGSPQFGNTGNTDHNSRFFFDKSKSAFRAGTHTNWNVNIGSHSIAFGSETRAGGTGSFVGGINTNSTGYTSFAFGADATASGRASVAIGEFSTATGDGSIALGSFSAATGYSSVAIGENGTASGKLSLVFGDFNNASSYGETTLGIFATNYTPNSPTTFSGSDRLFTIGNGTSNSNRSNAFQILKNGNTFINGTLTIDNNYTFPTAAGTNGQVLKTNGSGTLSWTTLTDSDNQNLSLSGNNLTISNGNSVDLSSFDSDNQNLSLSGNNLTISDGNSVDLSSFNTNIYNTNGNIDANERTLTFANTGATQHLTLQRSLNTDGLGIAFKNSGTFYTSFILVPSDGDGNDGGLDFKTKNDDGNLGSVGNTMRLTDNGTVTLPEYGQGNVTGTLAKVLAVTSSGAVIEKDISEVSTFEYDNVNNIFKPNAALSDIANDDFVFGAAQLDNATGADDDSRFFFDKSKGAFRAGTGSNTNWDAANVGDYSAAFGSNTKASGSYSFAAGDNNTASAAYSAAIGGDNTASGFYSFAVGNNNTASGIYATAMGIDNTSPSFGEVTIGTYATTYTPNSANSFNNNDRLFTIGNGTSGGNRSNALVVLKNGNTTIAGDLNTSYLKTVSGDLNISAEGWGMNYYIDTDANSSNQFKWHSDNVEIMALNESGNLTINGNLTENSDFRLKKNFQRIEQPLAKINALNGYYYHWKNRPDTTQQVGVIAQEVEAVLPQLVTTDNDGFKAVEYTKLTALLIEGMKAQQQQIDDLQAENAALKAQVDKVNDLEVMLLEMKAQLDEQDTDTSNRVLSAKQ